MLKIRDLNIEPCALFIDFESHLIKSYYKTFNQLFQLIDYRL